MVFFGRLFECLKKGQTGVQLHDILHSLREYIALDLSLDLHLKTPFGDLLCGRKG